MSKRVLSAFLVVPVLFLGLNFFIPSLSLIKEASAVTISEPSITGEGNFAGEEGSYRVSFNLTSPLLQNESIGIDFDDSFGFPGGEVEAIPNTPALSCVPQDTLRKISCGPSGNSVISGSISIGISGVINPANDGTYNVLITSTTQNFSKSVTIARTQSGGEDEGGDGGGGGGGGNSIFPDIESCDGSIFKKMGCWIRQILTYVPKLIVSFIIGILKFAIGAIIGVFILLAAELVKITAGLSFEGATAARIGYDVSLNLTNIGFIIFIIVIAFATILRKENYAIKKSLPRFIIIAMLINFSWFFANFAIDISNKVADGLMAAVGTVSGYPFSINQIGNLGTFFKSAFDGGNMDAILGKYTFAFPGLEFLLSLLKGLIEVIMQAIFGLIGFFALISTAVMLVIRYIVLSFLLALLPLALLLSIFPNLKIGGQGGAWEKWMGEFTKWLLFYPISMFFLAIGFATQAKLTSGTLELNPLQALNPLLAMVNILVVSGILIGGLIVASKMGLTGANFANSMASKTIRRMPANIAAIGKWGRRGSGGTDTTGSRPQETPRMPLQLAPLLGTAAEQAAAGQAGDLLNRFSNERANEPATFAELPEVQRPIPQEQAPTPTPAPQEQTPAPRPETPDTQQSVERPTPPPESAKPGKLSKMGGKIMGWSRSGPSTMEILGGGIKEFIGDRSKIFSGLYSGGGDEAKKAGENLGKLKEKYEDFDKELFAAEQKLREDSDETRPGKKLTDSMKKHYEGKIERLRKNRTERLDRMEGALKKAGKEVKRFSGKSEDIDKFITENRNDYQPTINT